MPDKDLDRLMRDHYGEDDAAGAPVRLADRIHAIPDVEPEPASTIDRWLGRVLRWRGDRHSSTNGNGRHHSVMAAATTATAVLAIAVLGVLALLDLSSSESPPIGPAEEPTVAVDVAPGEAGFMEARSVTLAACRTDQGIAPRPTAWREVDAGEDSSDRGGVSIWSLSSAGSIFDENEPRLEGVMTVVRNQSWTHDTNGRELTVQRNAYRIEADGGSWEGTSTRFSGNRAVSEMAPEVVTLTGAGGYAEMTAILQLPASDDRPECFEIHGVVVEDGIVPMPLPYRDDPGDIPVLVRPVEIALRDDGFGDAAESLVLEPGEQTIVVFNVGDRDHGFAIEDAAGRVLVGSPDEVIPPDERREYVVDLPASPGGYVLYDPLDRAATETVVASAE